MVCAYSVLARLYSKFFYIVFFCCPCCFVSVIFTTETVLGLRFRMEKYLCVGAATEYLLNIVVGVIYNNIHVTIDIYRRIPCNKTK